MKGRFSEIEALGVYRRSFTPTMPEDDTLAAGFGEWLWEDVECPKCDGSGKYLEHYHYDVGLQSCFNETGIWKCDIHHLCDGTGKIQQVMHPDFWEAVE